MLNMNKQKKNSGHINIPSDSDVRSGSHKYTDSSGSHGKCAANKTKTCHVTRRKRCSIFNIQIWGASILKNWPKNHLICVFDTFTHAARSDLCRIKICVKAALKLHTYSFSPFIMQHFHKLKLELKSLNVKFEAVVITLSAAAGARLPTAALTPRDLAALVRRRSSGSRDSPVRMTQELPRWTGAAARYNTDTFSLNDVRWLI